MAKPERITVSGKFAGEIGTVRGDFPYRARTAKAIAERDQRSWVKYRTRAEALEALERWARSQ